MSFSDLARARYSVRKFKPQPVVPELLEQVLAAGQAAPTACNNQPQRILVVQSGEGLEKIRACTPYSFHAPVVLVVCYHKKERWKRTRFDVAVIGEQDACIVTTHMMLAAADLGLGTTWVGCFDPAVLCKAFFFPDDVVPVALLPHG